MEDLKKQKIWVCWKREIKDSRPSKVLYSYKGFKTGTSEKYADHWGYYEEALLSKEKNDFDGIGLVLPPGIGGIDLDDIEADDPLVNEIRQVMKTYEELSPSGNGIHFLFKADTTKLPVEDGKLSRDYYSKNPHNDMEIYIGGLTNRYLTFTGEVITDLPVMERTEEVKVFLDNYMRREIFQFDNESESSLNDFDIIATARRAKNGDKFISLFDEGDTSNYGSHSEADQALCNILAFYTAGDTEQMDRLFRLSKLNRDKWDRDDYREATMDTAIRGCKGNFYLNGRGLPPYLYFNQRTNQLRVNCPALADYIRSDLDYIVVRDTDKSTVFRYLYEDGCYRQYPDDYFKGIIKGYITQYDTDILNMRDVNEVFSLLSTDLEFVSSKMLNTDEGLINFKNGLLRLEDMKLIPHSPKVLSTIQLPSEWNDDPNPTPVFDSFMDKLTDGDKEVENLLLEFMGVCVSNVYGYRMKKALFMVGPGDTGKSQLKRLMELILGSGNYAGIDLKEIEARFGTANIYNKRLAGSSDMSFVTIGELKTFKKSTGGDSIFAEFKGKDGFEFVYSGLLWFCMNRLPRFGGDDGKWVYDRILIVNCNNVIPLKDQDKLLLDKLYIEREGIIHKIILALKNVINNGYRFSEPDSVTALRESYMAENNTVIAFFNECIVQRPTLSIKDNCTTGKVYDVYKAWCMDNNHGYYKTAKEFRTDLSKFLNIPYPDLITRRGKGGNFYIRYTLSDEAKENYRKAYGWDEIPLLASNQ